MGWGEPTQQKGHTEYDPQIDAYIEGYVSGRGITSQDLAADGDHFSIVYDAADRHAHESSVTLKSPASTPPDSSRQILFSTGNFVYMGLYVDDIEGSPAARAKQFRRDLSSTGETEIVKSVIWWMELPDPK